MERFGEESERRKCQDIAEEVVRKRVKKRGRLRSFQRERRFSGSVLVEILKKGSARTKRKYSRECFFSRFVRGERFR